MPLVYDVTDPLYGAVGDGSTDDGPAIQAAIDDAGAAGGGVVYIPPTTASYAIWDALIGRDNVTVRGDGRASFIQNVRNTSYNSSAANTAVFRIGGYESNTTTVAWADTFYACADVLRGARLVTLTTAANAANFTAGDTVFLRTATIDQLQPSKEIPLACEVNEVLSVDPVAGTVTLRFPVGEDVAGASIAVAGERTLPVTYVDRGTTRNLTFDIRVLRRFVVEDLRLESPADFDIGIFSHGGAFECAFRRLDITGCTNGFLLNVMARCVVEDVQIRYSRRMGELAYLSHDNVFRNVRAFHAPASGVSAGNGFTTNEGARDTLFEHILLNHGTATTHAWGFGCGRRNRLVNSTILAPHCQNKAAVFIQARRHDFKPQACVIENCDIVTGTSDGDIYANYAIEIDSGGPYGGGCIVRDNRVYGTFRLAPIGLTRMDWRIALPPEQSGFRRYGCENNVVQGNVHVASLVDGERRVPPVSMVVEDNTFAPSGTPATEQFIDADFVPNLIADNQTRHRQRRVADYRLGGFTSATDPIRRYTIPNLSVGTNHRWVIEASGRVEAGQSTNAKEIRLFLGSVQAVTIPFAAAESGTWSLRVELAGAGTSQPYVTADTIVNRKVGYWSYTKNGTTTRGISDQTFNSANLPGSSSDDFLIDLKVTGSETVQVDSWVVTPSGDEWSFLNWTLLSDFLGGYPTIV